MYDSSSLGSSHVTYGGGRGRGRREGREGKEGGERGEGGRERRGEKD